MSRQTLLFVLALCTFVTGSLTAADPSPLYKPVDPDVERLVIEEHILQTPDRDIPLRITWPAGTDPCPVLIWCHGALGSKDAYQELIRSWVSHGYVVIQPTFGDSLVYLDAEQRRNMGTLAGLVNSPHVLTQWDKRPREVSLLIDRLPELEQAIPGLAGRLDAARLAVGGHSYGAHTSMLLAGVQPRVAWRSMSFRDPRVKAVLLVSPSGTSRILTEASFASLAAPALIITGDNDGSPMRGQEDKTGTWRRAVYDHAPPGDRYLLWIKDAHHNFGGISGAARWSGAGPDNPAQVELVRTTCLAMLDAYVKGDPYARAYLAREINYTTPAAPATLVGR